MPGEGKMSHYRFVISTTYGAYLDYITVKPQYIV